jgi:dehydratase
VAGTLTLAAAVALAAPALAAPASALSAGPLSAGPLSAGPLSAGPLSASVSASAAAVPVTFDCQASPPVGSPQQLTLSTSIQTDAPATVAAGATFEAVLAPDPMTVPDTAGGYSVNELRNLTLKIAVPQNSTYQSATLTGGSNLGSGTPAVSAADNVVTVSVPGPLAGGSTIQLPALHLNLVASGAAGTTIDTHLVGTSYADPGLTFTANVKVSFFAVDVPTSCFGNPAPTFTSTTIAAAPPAA